MFGETRPTSNMCVSSVAGETNAGECGRRARHPIARSLVIDMDYISHLTFMKCIKYVLFSHCPSQVIYYVIISFYIVVE